MPSKDPKSMHYNLALVDKIWSLKRLCEVHLEKHIPLSLVLKDQVYRDDLLREALASGHEPLMALAHEISALERDALNAAEQRQTQRKNKKKSAIKLPLGAILAFMLLVFVGGYGLRTLLPLEAGTLFTLNPAPKTMRESRLNPKGTPNSACGAVKADKPLFRLHGSNTLGEKLAYKLVESYLTSQGASNVHTSVNPLNANEKTIYGDINGRSEYVELHAHGSGTAFVDMKNGEADIGMSSRRIKDKEREELLGQWGDLTSPGNEHIVGLDGLAIINASSNSVSTLSIEQLVDIFSGTITNWQQLGGKDLAIKVYARDEKSGTWDTFKSLVLDTQKAQLSPMATRVESSSELSDAVAREDGAIGFIGLPYVRHAKLMAVSASRTSRAIMPTPFTLGTEDYPLTRRLYFYLSHTESSLEVADFIRFVASERGQAMVEEQGFVSQNIKLGKPFVSDVYPQEMRDLIVLSERLSINFRFKAASDELDSKSLRDLDRVAKYVAANDPKRVQLFGFSDSEGDREQSLELSARRAKVVEEQLMQRGIYALVVRGMGDAAPLAASTTEAGKHINRRVEVWIL